MKSMNHCAAMAMLLFFATVAFTAGAVSAGPPPGPMQDTQERWLRGPHPQRASACRTADLTEDQVARLRQLRRDFRAKTRDLRRELRQQRLALAAELAKKTPDAAKAVRIQKSISALRTELAQQRLEHLLQAKQAAPELDLSRLWQRNAFDHRR